MEIGYPIEEERMWTETSAPAKGHAGLIAMPLRNVLRTHSRGGGFEIAFDNENSYVIVEVIPAKIRRSVIDIGHQVLSGQRRPAAHCGGKVLHSEFFAKPVLCLSDSIRV